MSDWTGATGSAAGDIIACPPRLALPQAKESGAYADRGIALHLFCQQCTEHPERRLEWLAQVPEEWRPTAEGINLDAALDGITPLACEISYIVNVKDRTARLLGTGVDRQYAKRAAELGSPLTRYDVPLTIDLEGTVLDGVPVELDYKSGMYIGDPSEHGQRRLSAAALIFFHDTPSAISRVAYIGEDGSITPDGCEFSLFDAWEFCDLMVEAIDRVVAAKALVAGGGIPTVYPDRDKQCKYCACFHVCPFWGGLIRGAREGLDKLGPFENIPTIERGAALDYVKDVLKVATALEDSLKEYINNVGALPINDKYEYSARTQKGRMSFDAGAARGMIVTLMSRDNKSEDEIAVAIAGLSKKGKDYPVVSKKKRVLDVVPNDANISKLETMTDE